MSTGGLGFHSSLVSEFDGIVRRVPGFASGLWKYQSVIAGEILERLDSSRFVVVMIPTGSGKTLLEVFSAWVLVRRGFTVLAIEPTRFLVDQVIVRVWKPILEEAGVEVVSDYEGRCSVFESRGRVVVSTPQTALKCAGYLGGQMVALVVDEVHHAYSSKYYRWLVETVTPHYLVGFSALVPMERRLRIQDGILRVMGNPTYIAYDFNGLDRLGEYKAPKAILDIYEASLGSEIQNIYLRIYLSRLPYVDRRLQSFLANTLMKYGLDAYCESLRRAVEKNRLRGEYGELLSPCLNEWLENHKVRVLIDVLQDYWDESLKPVIVFTSRVSTANRAFKEITRQDVSGIKLRVWLLTGKTTKAERLRVLREAKNGNVDVIISSIVGEEGVDLPEAGLLVFLDTTKSPLRFYQRLGRLIRARSSRPVKYLVGVYTVGTSEYESLPAGVSNLLAEGIDVSYVVVNLEEKGLYRALKQYLITLVGGGSRIPFPELLHSDEKGKLQEHLDRYLHGKMDYYSVYEATRNLLARSRVFKEVWRMIEKGELAYHLDPTISSEILSSEILARIREVGEAYRRGETSIGDIKLYGDRAIINLGDIYTILVSKPVQSAYSIIIPIEKASSEAMRIKTEIEREYRRVGYTLSFDAERRTRIRGSKSKRIKWANLKLTSHLIGDSALTESIARYLGLGIDAKEVLFAFKVSSFRMYGFGSRPSWWYYAYLNDNGLNEGIPSLIKIKHYVSGGKESGSHRGMEAEYNKFLLVARGHILTVLRALNSSLNYLQEF